MIHKSCPIADESMGASEVHILYVGRYDKNLTSKFACPVGGVNGAGTLWGFYNHDRLTKRRYDVITGQESVSIRLGAASKLAYQTPMALANLLKESSMNGGIELIDPAG